MLAAGASTRLGKPKQLLKYKDKSLLQNCVQVATGAGTDEIIVVLGANAELLIKEIEHKNVRVVINTAWKEGIASSIRCGLQKLLAMLPATDAVIFMVCDQPFVTVKLLTDLVAKYRETGKPIIACSYENSVGIPALFDKAIFASLLALDGDAGAKKIIKENADWVSVVNFPLGNIDIDTDIDYNALLAFPLSNGEGRNA